MSMVNLESLAYAVDTDFRRSLLQGIALFRGIDAESLTDLLPQCGRIDVSEGQVLLSPERENQCVYVVLSGRLSVHLGSLDAPKIADLGPGSCAGEMSLIENKDPSAFVVAGVGLPMLIDRLARRSWNDVAWLLGVGITFRFLAGRVRRAPPWMQQRGLEWLHRLAQEPRRLSRRYLVQDVPAGLRLLGAAALRRGEATRSRRAPRGD